MSTIAFGRVSREREEVDQGTSADEKPPGHQIYVDALVAVIPGEVLALHALVMDRMTETEKPPGAGAAVVTTITGDDTALRLAFALLCGASVLLYWVGHRRKRPGEPLVSWDPRDVARALVPPTAFVLWTMLQPTSVFDAVWPDVDPEVRWLLALFGAAALGAVAAWLAGLTGPPESDGPAPEGLDAAEDAEPANP